MFAIAILAAGKGTRMKSSLPKVLHKIAGKTLLERVVGNALSLKPKKCLLITGHQAQAIKSSLKDFNNIDFVHQEPQQGTGHAIQQLMPELKEFKGDLLVLNGDVPLLGKKTLTKLLSKHKESQASVTLLSANLKNPKGYGRVFLNSNNLVTQIIEDKDCSEIQLKNTLINAGVYCFNWSELKNVLSRLTPNNSQQEIYLTDAIEKLPLANHIQVDDSKEIIGINNKMQLAECETILQKRLRAYWMEAGVTFIDPSSCTISEKCTFGSEVTIEPQTHLRGECKIGDNCTLGPDTLIIDSVLGDNVNVIKSVIDNSDIKDSVKIGPFAHLRPRTEISNDCRIGNFVETKNTQIGRGTKINHLSYIGDSILGNEVNIGAGTITANFDGFKKNKTVIGDMTKTGANSVLVAPITIEANVTIGAGSTITKDVSKNSLAIERSKQLIKQNWSKS